MKTKTILIGFLILIGIQGCANIRKENSITVDGQPYNLPLPEKPNLSIEESKLDGYLLEEIKNNSSRTEEVEIGLRTNINDNETLNKLREAGVKIRTKYNSNEIWYYEEGEDIRIYGDVEISKILEIAKIEKVAYINTPNRPVAI